MPFILLVIGAMFLVAAIRGTHGDLMRLFRSEFVGPNNFLFWAIAIFAIGMLGYIKPIRPLANGFLVLVVLTLLLSNPGFFQRFLEQIRSTEAATP